MTDFIEKNNDLEQQSNPPGPDTLLSDLDSVVYDLRQQRFPSVKIIFKSCADDHGHVTFVIENIFEGVSVEELRFEAFEIELGYLHRMALINDFPKNSDTLEIGMTFHGHTIGDINNQVSEYLVELACRVRATRELSVN